MKWSDKDISESIRLLEDGYSYKEIGTTLNKSYNSVRCKLQKLSYSYLKEQVVKKNCLNCNHEFTSSRKSVKKFCNNSCSASFNNKFRGKKLFNYCLNCKSQIPKRSKYCNRNCKIDHDRKIIYNKIENGESTLYESNYKKYLISKYGNKCMKCGWCEINPVTGKVPIQLEHIDGNSENNSLDNLKLLCPNCHSLTPTYGALNKGNGREKRRFKRLQTKFLNYGNLSS